MAFEEAAIDMLAQGAALMRSAGQDSAASEFEGQIRRYRVGLLKHRAILGAHGIKV